MKKFFLFFLLFPFCLMATTKVTIIGDSISKGGGATPGHGYVDLLQQRYALEGKDVVLINRSYSGAFTDTALMIGVETMTLDQPDYILFFVGIHDAMIAIPQQTLLNNLGIALSRCTGNCKAIILGGVSSSTVNPPYNTVLATVYQSLINAYEPYPVMLLGPEVLATSTDGIHPNNAGHQMIANYVYDALHAVGAY
jgi:lysophospholipase L1-like esterase